MEEVVPPRADSPTIVSIQRKMSLEQSPPARAPMIPKAALTPSLKWPPGENPQHMDSSPPVIMSRTVSVGRSLSRRLSKSPGGPVLTRTQSRSPVARTLSRTRSVTKPIEKEQELQHVDSLQDHPELLSPADVNILREVGKVPMETRVWGTDDKKSEKFAADILLKIPEYARFDQHTVRIMCHAAQWRQFKRGQPMTVEGDEQEEFFVVITGTVTGRITGRKPKAQVHTEKGGAEKDKMRIRRVPLDEPLGEEIERLNSGQGIGMGALLTGWDTWHVGYSAQTKVEVLAVPRTMLESIETTLKWSFDSHTLMDVLKEYQKLHPPLHAAQAATHGNSHGSLAQEQNRSRSEEWVTKISTAMRQVPSFRQLPQEAV
jgi:hypothetical protein